MPSPIVNESLPENALVNIRSEASLFFGNSNKVDDRLVDSFIDDIVKVIHRKRNFSWMKKYLDDDIPMTTGLYTLPTDCRKLFQITSQENEPESCYVAGVDYWLNEYNSDAVPARTIQWITPPSEDLAVRIWYYRKPTRAVGDSDIVDIPVEYTDLIRMGVQYKYSGSKGNLNEYDRFKSEFEMRLQEMIDDDTDPDITDDSRPRNADQTLVSYDTGELV